MIPHGWSPMNPTTCLPLGSPLREAFPLFSKGENGKEALSAKPLSYLDAAATTPKPKVIIDAMGLAMGRDYGTVHRGAYELSVKSSEAFENARKYVQAYTTSEQDVLCVFTKGTTESLNILAYGIEQALLRPCRRVVTTVLEHHSNFLPWQRAAMESGCEIAYIPLKKMDNGTYGIDEEKGLSLLSDNTSVLSIAHVGNLLGQTNPLQKLMDKAKSVGAKVIVDCAQSASSHSDDLFAQGADAVVFSAHKMFGPSGVGALVARKDLLDLIPPFQLGGGMVQKVTIEGWEPLPPPYRFEAGTPPISEAIVMAEALKWIQNIGKAPMLHHTQMLCELLADQLCKSSRIEVFKPFGSWGSVVSFRHKNIHAHDLATVFDSENIAIRAGHHCAWPLVQALHTDATARISFGPYSDKDDVERSLEAIRRAERIFQD